MGDTWIPRAPLVIYGRGQGAARMRGRQHLGRPSKLTDVQKVGVRRRRTEGAALMELAESYDVGMATISRLTA